MANRIWILGTSRWKEFLSLSLLDFFNYFFFCSILIFIDFYNKPESKQNLYQHWWLLILFILLSIMFGFGVSILVSMGHWSSCYFLIFFILLITQTNFLIQYLQLAVFSKFEVPINFPQIMLIIFLTIAAFMLITIIAILIIDDWSEWERIILFWVVFFIHLILLFVSLLYLKDTFFGNYYLLYFYGYLTYCAIIFFIHLYFWILVVMDPHEFLLGIYLFGIFAFLFIIRKLFGLDCLPKSNVQ